MVNNSNSLNERMNQIKIMNYKIVKNGIGRIKSRIIYKQQKKAKNSAAQMEI